MCRRPGGALLTPASTRRRRRTLAALGFTVYFVLVWLLWSTPWVAPLRLLMVLLHEVSHGLAALATGGSIREIVVTLDEGGWCVCPGGNAFVTLSAGYLGSLAWGTALLAAAPAGRRTSRLVLGGTGALLLAFAVLHVGGATALVVAGASGGVLLAASVKLGRTGRAVVLAFLGLTSSLYAVLDVKSDVLERPGAPSDAAALAEITGIPGLVWGVAWIGVSLAVSAWILRRVWRKL